VSERSERTPATERSDGARDAVSTGDAATPEERRALFRVVRGTPTDEELAAVTVVLAALAAAPPPADPRPVVASAWNGRAARLRGPLTVGPGAWRTSTWPR
jgi:hypothetical protein